MYRDLTRGPIAKSLILFSLPMIAGNLLQQFYNIADTLIVGRVLGETALAAVGSAYTLMTFLTSIFLGLSMGSGALFSIYKGRNDSETLRGCIAHALVLIVVITLILNVLVFLFSEQILAFLRVPENVIPGMREYLRIIFVGLLATSIYNFFACTLRAMGNSAVPLTFLAVSAILNIGLDLLFVIPFQWEIAGAAWATVISQFVSALGLLVYCLAKCRNWLPRRSDFRFRSWILKEIWNLSALTCVQQSVMNFGILMVQGLVNSFGETIMAAFAAAVKIDTFAYLPVQDFGNAFSTFIAQNYGAKDESRIREGTRKAFALSAVFSIAISAPVVLFARPLMTLLVNASAREVIAAGAKYLRVEGAFYVGIGLLFLFYGYFRAIQKPMVSVVLTVISLGTRVALAYLLSGYIGEIGIWLAIPIGWALADGAGWIQMIREKKA